LEHFDRFSLDSYFFVHAYDARGMLKHYARAIDAQQKIGEALPPLLCSSTGISVQTHERWYKMSDFPLLVDASYV